MTRNSAAAFALASLCACAGSYTNGSTPINPIDGGGQGISTDGGGDAGADGGVDGGADAGVDAGCVQLSLNNVPAIDGCGLSPQSGTATVSVDGPAQGCFVSITLATPSMLFCTGSANHGTLDAFTGSCGGMPCISASIPGTLTCNDGGSSCNIEICAADAGTCQ